MIVTHGFLPHVYLSIFLVVTGCLVFGGVFRFAVIIAGWLMVFHVF